MTKRGAGKRKTGTDTARRRTRRGSTEGTADAADSVVRRTEQLARFAAPLQRRAHLSGVGASGTRMLSLGRGAPMRGYLRPIGLTWIGTLRHASERSAEAWVPLAETVAGHRRLHMMLARLGLLSPRQATPLAAPGAGRPVTGLQSPVSSPAPGELHRTASHAGHPGHPVRAVARRADATAPPAPRVRATVAMAQETILPRAALTGSSMPAAELRSALLRRHDWQPVYLAAPSARLLTMARAVAEPGEMPPATNIRDTPGFDQAPPSGTRSDAAMMARLAPFAALPGILEMAATMRRKAQPGTPAPTMDRRIRAAALAARSEGMRLQRSVAQTMGSILGADVRHVRIHTGDAAAHAASLVHAQAFTVGRDVYFGRGAFQTATPAGLSLLGHELAHATEQVPVVQRLTGTAVEPAHIEASALRAESTAARALAPARPWPIVVQRAAGGSNPLEHMRPIVAPAASSNIASRGVVQPNRALDTGGQIARVRERGSVAAQVIRGPDNVAVAPPVRQAPVQRQALPGWDRAPVDPRARVGGMPGTVRQTASIAPMPRDARDVGHAIDVATAMGADPSRSGSAANGDSVAPQRLARAAPALPAIGDSAERPAPFSRSIGHDLGRMALSRVGVSPLVQWLARSYGALPAALSVQRVSDAGGVGPWMLAPGMSLRFLPRPGVATLQLQRVANAGGASAVLRALTVAPTVPGAVPLLSTPAMNSRVQDRGRPHAAVPLQRAWSEAALGAVAATAQRTAIAPLSTTTMPAASSAPGNVSTPADGTVSGRPVSSLTYHRAPFSRAMWTPLQRAERAAALSISAGLLHNAVASGDVAPPAVRGAVTSYSPFIPHLGTVIEHHSGFVGGAAQRTLHSHTNHTPIQRMATMVGRLPARDGVVPPARGPARQVPDLAFGLGAHTMLARQRVAGLSAGDTVLSAVQRTVASGQGAQPDGVAEPATYGFGPRVRPIVLTQRSSRVQDATTPAMTGSVASPTGDAGRSGAGMGALGMGDMGYSTPLQRSAAGMALAGVFRHLPGATGFAVPAHARFLVRRRAYTRRALAPSLASGSRDADPEGIPCRAAW